MYFQHKKLKKNISCFPEMTKLLNFCLSFWSFDFLCPNSLHCFISICAQNVFTQHMRVCQQNKLSTFISSRDIRSHIPGRGLIRDLVATPTPAPCPLITITQGPQVPDPPSSTPGKILQCCPENHISCSQFVHPHLFLSLSSSSHPWKRYYAAAFSIPSCHVGLSAQTSYIYALSYPVLQA